jgi:hypothetical protein
LTAASLAFAAVLAAMEVDAEAQAPAQIQRNDYALEIFQGPLFAPGRITGLAGATTATAESLEGVYNNAAAPAVREAYSFDHFEWEPAGGIAFPGAYGGTDFDNRGDQGLGRDAARSRQTGVAGPSTVETTDRFLYLNAGLWGQIGNFGLTATADSLRYDVGGTADKPSLAVGITRFHLVGAYAFLKNQLIVGAGFRMAYVDIHEVDNPDASVIAMFGVAPQLGMIVKPQDRPWRVGLTARAPVSASSFSLTSLISEQRVDGTVVRRAGTSFILPERIVQPWELEAGLAYQLGPRPLNPGWIDPVDDHNALMSAVREHRLERSVRQREEIESLPIDTPLDRRVRAQRIAEITQDESSMRAAEDSQLANAERILHDERKARYLNWPRQHVLLLASVLMTGASSNAVALEGFIEQQKELVGTHVSVSPRFAVESEAVPNLLKTRAGIYVEPSRFVDGTAREHFTIGLDVRLFAWGVFGIFPSDHEWRLSSFLDIAQRYQNFGFGVGTWH